MNKSILLIAFFFFLSTVSTFAEVKSANNPSLPKSDRKVAKECVKRTLNFYGWYLNFIIANHNRPLQHAVINQNASPHLRDLAAKSENKYDVFLASENVDEQCDIEISPVKKENNKFTLLAKVTGKFKYNFHIDMMLIRDEWKIDAVTADGDSNMVEGEK